VPDPQDGACAPSDDIAMPDWGWGPPGGPSQGG
jgi:hypothetical protein